MWPRIRYPFQPDSARYARTYRSTRLFSVWPVGHLLSSHEERRQRRAKGGALGIPDTLIFRAIVGLHNGGWPAPKLAGVESPSGAGPEFSLGKPAGGRTPEPAYIQKRGCGPGAWVAIKSYILSHLYNVTKRHGRSGHRTAPWPPPTARAWRRAEARRPYRRQAGRPRPPAC